MAFYSKGETVEFCRASKVMYFLRGLPGSGKTTIAKEIAIIYGHNAAICSADDYTVNEEGAYQWRQSEYEQTHKLCLEKARSLCEEARNVIIIDNTNIYLDKVQPYFKLCFDYDYIAVIIEPSTPWKYDVEELARRSEHTASQEIISELKSCLKPIIPYFYGWFFSFDDSKFIQKTGLMAMNNLLKFREFVEDQSLNLLPRMQEEFDLRDFYTIDKATTGKDMLHITACFVDEGQTPWCESYINETNADLFLGKVSKIEIIGWFITPRTIGARIYLSQHQVSLWGKKDAKIGQKVHYSQEAVTDTLGTASNIESGAGEDIGAHQTTLSQTTSDQTIPSHISPREPKKESKSDGLTIEEKRGRFVANFKKEFLVPSFEKGCTAHITLGCTEGVSPKQTGYDLKDIISCELDEDPSFEVVADYLVRNYSAGRWICYLRSPIVAPVMFTGFYRYGEA
eukprot:Seg1229.2 transcript_id=Seg1229.2/GoldUCD/mRNA.D3Y31 product="2' 3'-cyclic-nucleotide 3'-phosphodiesterase" protein_id=Seg1229.2/GoldUCD/D3Y31